MFGDISEEYLEIAYLDGKSYANLELATRKYMRLAGGNLNLNTIFPKNIPLPDIDLEAIAKKYLGQFDISKLYK